MSKRKISKIVTVLIFLSSTVSTVCWPLCAQQLGIRGHHQWTVDTELGEQAKRGRAKRRRSRRRGRSRREQQARIDKHNNQELSKYLTARWIPSIKPITCNWNRSKRNKKVSRVNPTHTDTINGN